MTSEALTQERCKLTLRQDIGILVVEDEHAHYLLAKHCLRKADVANNMPWFKDGQAVLDIL